MRKGRSKFYKSLFKVGSLTKYEEFMLNPGSTNKARGAPALKQMTNTFCENNILQEVKVLLSWPTGFRQLEGSRQFSRFFFSSNRIKCLDSKDLLLSIKKNVFIDFFMKMVFHFFFHFKDRLKKKLEQLIRRFLRQQVFFIRANQEISF